MSSLIITGTTNRNWIKFRVGFLLCFSTGFTQRKTWWVFLGITQVSEPCDSPLYLKPMQLFDECTWWQQQAQEHIKLHSSVDKFLITIPLQIYC